MGMFDNVKCEYPLPDGWEGEGLQSKDGPCEMITITITEDGRMLSDQRPWYIHDDEDKEIEPIEIPYHGMFRFYGSDYTNAQIRNAEGGVRAIDPSKIEWHDYVAKFTDGRLVALVVGDHEWWKK